MDSSSAPVPPVPADPYSSHLSADDRAAWNAVSGEVDLHFEIRLLRALIRQLAHEGLVEREAQLRLALAVLLRLVSVQGRDRGVEEELERELAEAAERVLLIPGGRDELDDLRSEDLP